ncbi:uncharacterized protein LTR77_003261 [Saxophila tyrrhenica]|uniref:Oxidoreductase n=1 Tax=Saxophila tyrrhenica TaxID=1690608 RepID=A0AAV9PHB7_9PEZI|nr:hypothetical protein LTR77_003261 [Saxophila tyrrhenica]
MPNVLVVGASRGLGFEVAKTYSQKDYQVFATTRSPPPSVDDKNINWVQGVDIGTKEGGETIVAGLKGQQLDIVVVTAGYFPKESLDEPDFDQELQTYKTCAIGPVFVVHALYKAKLLQSGTKVILVSSEAGSIGLRHESEGGGLYAHHGSKAALNMAGKLLSLDLKEAGVAVAMVHPGFMRTDMTKNVGFDKFWDAGGAVTPDVAAKSMVEWADTFDISHTGEYWAPRGPGDIGTAEQMLGPKDKLPTPLQLPW